MFVRESLPRERCLFRNERTITVNYYLVDCKVFIEMRRNREKSFAFYFVDFNGNDSSIRYRRRCANFNKKRYLRYTVRHIFIQYKLKKLILFRFAVGNFTPFQSKLLRVVEIRKLYFVNGSRAKIESRISLIPCYRMYIFYYIYIEYFR